MLSIERTSQMDKERETLAKGMDYALRLLSFRMRTESELRDRLGKKGYDQVIEQVVDRLKEMNYVNDAQYVEYFMRSKAKPTGRQRLKYELLQKGVPRVLVESSLTVNYSPEQELAGARQLALRLWDQAQRRKIKADSEKNTTSREHFKKIYSKLVTRGFSASIIAQALREIEAEFIED